MMRLHALSDRSLRTDVLVAALIVAFTALPTQLRLPDAAALRDALHPDFSPVDVITNVLGYIPLGMALARRRALAALLFCAAISGGTELAQLFVVGRHADSGDFITNFAGAGLGLVLGRGWRILPERIPMGPRSAAWTAVVALAYVVSGATFTADVILNELNFLLESAPWKATNPRGTSAAGIRELHRDSADSLNGAQWVDLGNSTSLRLTGSMTLSAWVKPLAYPPDDAAVISSLSAHEVGYQLDLTIDQGPRTIGFKVADASDHLMIRYGKTPIALGEWHHIAGVYDAKLRTLEVYVDGRADSGCLIGTVTSAQLPSAAHVFVGRRAGFGGYEFTGVIDKVEIQSRALSASQIQAEVRADGRLADPIQAAVETRCVPERQDVARIAGPLAAFGMALVVAFAGLWRGPRFDRWALGACLLFGATSLFWIRTGAALEFAILAPLYILTGGLVAVWASRR